MSITAEHFNVQSGLSYNDVYAIAEDRRGLIWIGTRYGINRFDGQRFKKYLVSDGLQEEGVDGIYVDGDLLVLLHIDPADGTNLHRTASVLHTITEEITPFGEYWLDDLPFAWSDLLQIESSESRKHLVFRLQSGAAYLYLGSGKFREVELLRGERIKHVLPNGDHWTMMSGWRDVTYRYRKSDGQVQKTYRYNWRGWYEIASWVGFNAELEYAYVVVPSWDAQKKMGYTAFKTLSASGEVSTTALTLNQALEDGESLENTIIYGRYSIRYLPPMDLLWVAQGYRGHLETVDGKLVAMARHLFEEVELQERQLLVQDSVIWLPSHNGIYKMAFNRVSFTQLVYRSKKALNYRTIFKRDTTMYAINEKGIVAIEAPASRKEPKLLNMLALSMLQTGEPPNDTIWSINHGQLRRGIPSTGALKSAETEITSAWAMQYDPPHHFWVGNRGMYRVDMRDFSVERIFTPQCAALEQAIVYQFWEGAGDTSWLVTTNGLFETHRTKGVLGQYGNQQGGDRYLPANEFRYLYARSPEDSIFWLATGGKGLLRWNRLRKTSEQYQFGDGSTNTLHAIIPDDYGFLWCSSDKGLIQFDPRTKRYRVYLSQDGLLVDEFNRISFYKDTLTGALYFGTVNGVLRFHPRDFKTALSPTVQGQPYLVDAYELERGDSQLQNILPDVLHHNRITVRPRVTQLTLSFSVSNSLWSTAVAYEYRIVRDTQSRALYTPTIDNILQLGRLPYGKSYLQVRAFTATGQELAQTLVIPLRVGRPYYVTWWFFTLCALAIMSLSYAVYRFQRLQDRKRNDLRVRISRDLHDNVGALLSSILMQIQLLGHLMPGKRRDELQEELMQNTMMAIDSVRDVVWATDARKDSYEDLLVRLEEQLRDLERSRRIPYRFDIKRSGDLPSLTADVRKHIFFIFREAIINTIKHSSALSVQLRVMLEGRQLIIEYTERLPFEGLNTTADEPLPATAKTGQGISNMHQRAAESGGTLEMQATDQVYRVRYIRAFKRGRLR